MSRKRRFQDFSEIHSRIHKADKINRVLQLYAKLSDGYIINKTEEAELYGVDERSIQRDIDDIRNFLDNDSERILLLFYLFWDW